MIVACQPEPPDLLVFLDAATTWFQPADLQTVGSWFDPGFAIQERHNVEVLPSGLSVNEPGPSRSRSVHVFGQTNSACQDEMEAPATEIPPSDTVPLTSSVPPTETAPQEPSCIATANVLIQDGSGVGLGSLTVSITWVPQEPSPSPTQHATGDQEGHSIDPVGKTNDGDCHVEIARARSRSVAVISPVMMAQRCTRLPPRQDKAPRLAPGEPSLGGIVWRRSASEASLEDLPAGPTASVAAGNASHFESRVFLEPLSASQSASNGSGRVSRASRLNGNSANGSAFTETAMCGPPESLSTWSAVQRTAGREPPVGRASSDVPSAVVSTRLVLEKPSWDCGQALPASRSSLDMSGLTASEPLTAVPSYESLPGGHIPPSEAYGASLCQQSSSSLSSTGPVQLVRERASFEHVPSGYVGEAPFLASPALRHSIDITTSEAVESEKQKTYSGLQETPTNVGFKSYSTIEQTAGPQDLGIPVWGPFEGTQCTHHSSGGALATGGASRLTAEVENVMPPPLHTGQATIWSESGFPAAPRHACIDGANLAATRRIKSEANLELLPQKQEAALDSKLSTGGRREGVIVPGIFLHGWPGSAAAAHAVSSSMLVADSEAMPRARGSFRALDAHRCGNPSGDPQVCRGHERPPLVGELPVSSISVRRRSLNSMCYRANG